jgi:hypothetical protein
MAYDVVSNVPVDPARLEALEAKSAASTLHRVRPAIEEYTKAVAEAEEDKRELLLQRELEVCTYCPPAGRTVTHHVAAIRTRMFATQPEAGRRLALGSFTLGSLLSNYHYACWLW